MDTVTINITELIDNVTVNIDPQVDSVDISVSPNIYNVLVGVTEVTDTVAISAVSQIDSVLIEINEGSIIIPGVSGDPDWMDLVRGYKTIPVFNSAIIGGDVYDYVYETTGPDLTYYRYIATDLSIDGFYSMFDGSSVTDLITEKKIVI